MKSIEAEGHISKEHAHSLAQAEMSEPGKAGLWPKQELGTQLKSPDYAAITSSPER